MNIQSKIQEIKLLDQNINEAKQHLDTSQQILNELLLAADEESSLEDTVLAIQLLLQYRLNCEDALALLFQIDQHLLYLLGIQPQQSSAINLERLSYAVGHDDFKHLLNILAALIDSLAKIIARYQKEQASFTRKYQKLNKSHSIRSLQKLNTSHKQFIHTLESFTLDIKKIVKHQAAGPLHDHIAALRGPISQFQQINWYSLEHAKLLYEKIDKTQALKHELAGLVKQARDLLHHMPSIYKLGAHPEKLLDSSNDKLEKRAAAKRLLPFFS